jgi:Uncharacterized conserved protein
MKLYPFIKCNLLPPFWCIIQIVACAASLSSYQQGKIVHAAFSSSTSRQPSIIKSHHTNEYSRHICSYYEVKIPTTSTGPPRQAISVEDLTPTIQSLLTESGLKNGSINVISRHTTTAVTINERESRLARDMEKYFLSLAPPDERSSAETAQKGIRYFHNDIDQRPDSPEEAQRCRENGWDIDNPEQLQKWRDQEPINAHSHLLSMLLGSSECIPVVDGEMVIGQVSSDH